MPIANWEKFGYPEQLHVILNGLYNFYEKNQRLPRPLDEADATELIGRVTEFQKNKIDEEGF